MIAQAIRIAAVDKFNGQIEAQKMQNEINFTPFKQNKLKRVNILRSDTIRSNEGDIKRLIFLNNRHNFQTFDEAMSAFQKHSEKIAIKLQAEREDSK